MTDGNMQEAFEFNIKHNQSKAFTLYFGTENSFEKPVLSYVIKYLYSDFIKNRW